ncbi:hypothetical protein RsTz2092_06790 [Deferribacterales bacterium RsTz2092]|nr:hypothetical protein AGMMS49941_10820 [Deferribacterales bacterium]
MLQILYFGSKVTGLSIQVELRGYAQLVSSGKVNLCVCEVATVADIANIPTGSNVNIPILLYLNTNEKTIIEKLRGMRVHGVFYPPINGDAMKKKIDQLLNLDVPIATGGANDFERLKIKILAKTENVPMLPVIVNKIIAMSKDKNVPMSAVTEQVKMDQGISSKVVRMVNSPFFMLREHVSSIDKAIVLVGGEAVKNIALATATNSYYNKPFKMYDTTGTALWAHAYMVAVLCEMLAREAGADPDMYFLAGLFHDIGKIVLVEFLVQIVHDAQEERAQIKLDHAEVAGMIAERWQLAGELVQALKMHHDPQDNVIAKTVFWADRLAHFSKKRNDADFEAQFTDLMEKLVKGSGLVIKNVAGLAEKIKELLKAGDIIT